MIRRDQVEELVMTVIADTFSVPRSSIHAATQAFDIDGWDSLTHTTLMVRLQRRLGIKIPERIAARARSVGELVEMIRAEVPSGAPQ